MNSLTSAIETVYRTDPSKAGQRKERARKTLAGDLPLQSFENLLGNLASLAAGELWRSTGCRSCVG